MSAALVDLITRGIVTAKNGIRKMRTLQVRLFADDVRDDVEHFEPYGFSSEPRLGAEVLAASLAGDRGHTIVFCVPDRRYRPTGMQDGEVVVFDDLGRKVYISRAGIVVEGKDSPVTVKSSASVTIDAPVTNITGTLNVTGDIVGKAQIYDAKGRMQSMRDTYNTHVHGNSTTPNQQM